MAQCTILNKEVNSEQCTVYTCTVYSVQCTVYSVQYSVQVRSIGLKFVKAPPSCYQRLKSYSSMEIELKTFGKGDFSGLIQLGGLRSDCSNAVGTD